MDFPRFSSPFLAILQVDLMNLTRSWAVRIWALLMTGQLLIMLPTATAEFIPASESLAGLLGTFPIIWSTFIIIVCSGAVASESGVIADSILSKSVTRYEYILAKFSGRLILVLGFYLIISVPAALLLASNADNDMTNAGAIWGIVSVAMMLLLLTSLSVGLSTLFNRTLVALMVVWFLWYVSNGIFALLQLDFLSPILIIDNMQATLRGSYETGDQVQIVAVFGLLSTATIGGAIAYFARKDL